MTADIYPSAATATAQLSALLALLTFHERQFLSFILFILFPFFLLVFPSSAEARCLFVTACCAISLNDFLFSAAIFPLKLSFICAAGKSIE